jgi:hypothetical protein
MLSLIKTPQNFIRVEEGRTIREDEKERTHQPPLAFQALNENQLESCVELVARARTPREAYPQQPVLAAEAPDDFAMVMTVNSSAIVGWMPTVFIRSYSTFCTRTMNIQ